MSKRKDGTYTGNQTISVRMPSEYIKLLNKGLELSGFNRPDFVKEAIKREVERLERNK